jgi:hypothetical protein
MAERGGNAKAGSVRFFALSRLPADLPAKALVQAGVLLRL